MTPNFYRYLFFSYTYKIMSLNHLADNDTEILDVVDENDQVIGQMPKEQIHAGSKILHREIGVLVYNDKNEVLLQQRSFKKKFFPGSWTTTAVGHVPSGKTPLDAAHMELIEELGFDTDLDFVEKRKYVSGDHISFGYLFMGKFPSNAKITIDPDEVETTKFVSHDEAVKMEDSGEIDYHTKETLDKFYHGNFIDK